MPPEWASHVGCWMARLCRPENCVEIPSDDSWARDTARLFPRREVVQVPTRELAKADCDIHCTTQQQSAS